MTPYELRLIIVFILFFFMVRNVSTAKEWNSRKAIHLIFKF